MREATETEKFLAELAAIAETPAAESVQLQQARQSFLRFISEARACLAGGEHVDSDVRKLADALKDRLGLEINRARPGRRGALLDRMRGVVRDWLRENPA